MATKLEELYVEVRARTDKLDKDLQEIKAKTQKTATAASKSLNIKGAIASLGIGLVIKKLFELGVAAKDAARDAEETRTKFEQVFISIKEEAIDAGDAFAKSFGLATDTAQRLLGNTGDLLVGFGFTEKAALDLTLQVNSLAQDLASFQNVSGADASLALTKAMLGETESAKRLGIAIKSDDKIFVQNVERTMLMTGATYTQAKALEVLKVAQTQSAKAVGDFSRTQDGLANQERIATEQARELSVQIGQKLIPIFASATSVAIDFFRSLTETDLETTIRQLEELGAKAEDLKVLKDLNVQVKLETNRVEVLEDLEDIRENVQQNSIIRWLVPSSQPDIVQFIANSKKEMDGLRSAVIRATDSTTPLSSRMSELEALITEVVSRAKAVGIEIERSGPTDNLVKQVNNYSEQAQYLSNILGKLKSIESVSAKITSNEDEKTSQLFFQNGLVRDQGTFTTVVAEKTRLLSERIAEETLKLTDLQAALGNLPYDATTAQIDAASLAMENQQKLVEKLSGKRGGKSDSFLPEIPSGYTADQVAMYESLQYEAEGYVAYVTAVINQKYANDISAAEGSAEKILQIEEEKLLSIAKLNQEQTDREKTRNLEQAQSFRDLMAEIDAANKDAQNKVDAQNDEYNSNRIEAIESYYDYVRGADESYWTQREAQIQAEVDAYLLATENKLQAEILFAEKMEELDEEKAAAKSAKMRTDTEDFQQFAGIMGQTKGMFAESTAAYKAMAVTEATIATYLGAAKALGEIPFPFGFIAAAAVIASGMANVGSILSAADGGTFAGGKKIASFAGGGSMTVPLGYPNDSFPVMVQSGERLQVTPANQVGEQEKLLGTLIGSVNALNMNLLNKNMSSTSNITIDGKSIAKSVYKVTKKLEDEGTNLDLL